MVPILVERNVVLARSIVGACLLDDGDRNGAVVAVLGMAHCNGVKRLIEGGLEENEERRKKNSAS
jgi:pheromone shutdown protein TraB